LDAASNKRYVVDIHRRRKRTHREDVGNRRISKLGNRILVPTQVPQQDVFAVVRIVPVAQELQQRVHLFMRGILTCPSQLSRTPGKPGKDLYLESGFVHHAKSQRQVVTARIEADFLGESGKLPQRIQIKLCRINLQVREKLWRMSPMSKQHWVGKSGGDH
jgi:hypothetical protein